MPFITEEVWQRVAPLPGKVAGTLMLQPYPIADASRIDEAAEADIEWLKTFILGVRQILGEMNIAPVKPLPLLIQGAGADDLSRLAKMKSAIEFLARVESPRVLSDDEAAPQSATALVGTTKLLVPMAGLIDKDAELARLAKQIAKLESDLEKTATRIANPNFGKAPPAVQEQAHQHQRKLAADLSALQDQHQRIAIL